MDRELPSEHAGQELPPGWRVWSEEDGVVVCYRPDVFDAAEYPRPCIPLLTVTKADSGTMGGREGWRVTFHLEADVPAYSVQKTLPGYDEAIDYLVDVAERFNAGELDLRGIYAEGDVREEYVARIEEEIEG